MDIQERFLFRTEEDFIIGKGASALVVKAFDKLREKEVALKIDHSTGVFKKQIHQEIKLLSRFQHSNIVPLYDVMFTQFHFMENPAIVLSFPLANQLNKKNMKIEKNIFF